MRKNILISGKPRSGKSTLLKNVLVGIPQKVGLMTDEILVEDKRVGFEMETSNGQKETLAHVDFESPNKVARYFVKNENLDALIPSILEFGEDDALYIDEIGEMQLLSPRFRDLVLTYFSAPNSCIATISSIFDDAFTKALKDRDDVILVEISVENRSEMERFVSQFLRKIEKAKRYISEPERFSITDLGVSLRSEHGVRQLLSVEGKWECDCEFFEMHGICSHVIATEGFATNSVTD